MKKEIREKVKEFKSREQQIIMAINENPSDSKLKAEFMKIRKEKRDWLNELGGRLEVKNAQEAAMLDTLISEVEIDMSKVAKREAELSEYITQSAKKAKEIQPGYERTIDDKGQMIAIIEQSVMDKIRRIDKFNKKRNKKSFLNIAICKFKKSKQQSQESEQQGPSQE